MRPLRVLWSFLLLVAAFGVPASAHPLGNFTVNHLARITVTPGQLRVRYYLDIAEIPTFQIMQQAGGRWTPQAAQTWARSEIGRVQRGLRIRVDGAAVALQPAGTPRTYPRPGAGGLPILYWYEDFQAPLQSGVAHTVVAVDRTYADRRIGWKDLIVAPPQTEPTDNLLHYPSALIGTPDRVNSTSFTIAPNGAVSHIVASEDTAPPTGTTAYYWFAPTTLSGMFSRGTHTPLWILLTILAAFGLGALHAVEPGHGKALLAVTLVGARATTRQAVILGASLTFAHTIGVLLLGVALLFAANFVSETIYPWITLASGIAVAFIGARSLGRFVRSRRELAHAHTHVHDGAHPHHHDHAHAHDHDHAEGHGHSHVIPGSQPIKFSSAVWAAMSGGVAPCPAAIVVLLTAVRLHQVGYGLLLIVIFSMGLASVLIGLGFGVVHGAAWLSRRSGFDRVVRFGPLLSACVISIIGSVIVAQGVAQQGLNVSLPVVAGLTFMAIVGYALAQHGHTHRHAPAPTEQIA